MADIGIPNITSKPRLTGTNMYLPDNSYASIEGGDFTIGSGMDFTIGSNSFFMVNQ